MPGPTSLKAASYKRWEVGSEDCSPGCRYVSGFRVGVGVQIQDLEKLCNLENLETFIERQATLSSLIQPRFLLGQGEVGRSLPAPASPPPVPTCREGLSAPAAPRSQHRPCLHLVNKVGKGPGSSSPAPSAPDALNGHDTALNFRFSATAGAASAGGHPGPVTAPSTGAISLPVIRCRLEPAVLQRQSSADLHNRPLFESQALRTREDSYNPSPAAGQGGHHQKHCLCHQLHVVFSRTPRGVPFTSLGVLLFILSGMFPGGLGEVRCSLAVGGVLCRPQGKSQMCDMGGTGDELWRSLTASTITGFGGTWKWTRERGYRGPVRSEPNAAWRGTGGGEAEEVFNYRLGGGTSSFSSRSLSDL